MNNYKRVQEINKKLGLDAVLVSNGCNMRYISGFTGETGYLFISDRHHMVITDFRYTYQAEMEAEGYEIVTIGSGGYEEAINEILKNDNVKRLGFEAKDMLYSKYRELKDKLNVDELVPVNDEITRLRRIKTSREIEYIRQAESIGDKVFAEILDFIRPGMTELEIAARIEYLLKVYGAREPVSLPLWRPG